MAYLMKSRKRKRNKRPRDRLKYFIIDTQQLPNIVLSKSNIATIFRAQISRVMKAETKLTRIIKVRLMC